MKDVVVAGGTGRTGRAVVQYLSYQPNVRVIAIISRRYAGLQGSSIISDLAYEIPIFPDFITTVSQVKPTVWIDFTEPGIGKEHFQQCMEQGIHPIIGTTGFSKEEQETFNNLCISNELGGALIPNFSLGALLMLQAVRLAAEMFLDVAVIDMYPPHKTETPSGTSKQLLAELKRLGRFTDKDLSSHSLRLSGAGAFQEVKFGGVGETVTISHNVSDRTCFGIGVVKAIEKIEHFKRLVTDLGDFI